MMAGVTTNEPMPRGVLWDFDGTLLDTEKVWIVAEIEEMASHGVTWTHEQGVHLCGTSWDVSTAALEEEAVGQGVELPLTGWPLYERIYRRVVRHLLDDGLPWLPGVPELLAELSERGIPMAVVSASPAELIDAGVSQMTPGLFGAIVNGQQMPQSKPAPDGYLRAAELLGVPASDCIVIEDSVAGTASGRAAGAAVIAVPCMHPLDEAPGQVNLDSLAGVDYAELGCIWQQAKESIDE